ncbi:ABC-2 type transport system permease protein [Orbus hercynius]|uniref:ABC-2 type transport system permease protein n=1 Tax=Orbus hercynius TaxID=593135 RepID=A0A495RF74_9GAMM|nr:ABC transporter permease [Orbus hercynius]RKS86045.1 ABC-2 type transport system permease protein [Orbus hercynius]
MLKMYWGALKRILLRLLTQPKWLLLLVSISLMSLVYSKGSITDLPIAVVDLDHSASSRDLTRALATSAKVTIVSYDNSSDAYRDINARKVFAVITIPRDYEKRLIKGDSVTIAAYGDASSRLANGQIQQDLKAIYQQFLIDYNAVLMRNSGFTDAQIDIVLSPIKGQTDPLFNPGISLAAINFPGLLVMLLQHSLLLASTRTHIALNTLPQGKPSKIIFLGSFSALFPIWLFLSIILFGLWPWILGYRQLASLPVILLMALPFLFAVMGLAKLLTECLRRVEMIYLTLSFITTPVFYLSGTIWPLDAMPYWVQCVAKLLPSTWAVNMIAGVNQMGLHISDNGFNLLMLIVLGIVYLSLGIFISALREGRVRQFIHHWRIVNR